VAAIGFSIICIAFEVLSLVLRSWPIGAHQETLTTNQFNFNFTDDSSRRRAHRSQKVS